MRFRWRNFLSYAMLSLMLAVLLAACGDNTPTPATSSTTAAATTAASSTTALVATTAAAAATTAATGTTAAAGATTAASGTTAATGSRVVTGGTFRYTLSGEPDSLDPNLATSQEAVIIMGELFDGP